MRCTYPSLLRHVRGDTPVATLLSDERRPVRSHTVLFFVFLAKTHSLRNHVPEIMDMTTSRLHPGPLEPTGTPAVRGLSFAERNVAGPGLERESPRRKRDDLLKTDSM